MRSFLKTDMQIQNTQGQIKPVYLFIFDFLGVTFGHVTVGGIALSFKRSPFAVTVVHTACAIILGPDAFSRCVQVVGAQEIDVKSQKHLRQTHLINC